jgi:ribose 5-phosphate isomerase B
VKPLTTVHEIIAFGSDHAGLPLKEFLKETVIASGYQVLDCGTGTLESVDYPDFAHAVVQVVTNRQAGLGVLVCGTGIGMSMAANRQAGIRAALVHTELEARLSREHNNANILCLGGRIIGQDQARACLLAFLDAHYQGGRHDARLAKIDPVP